jgi:hypothetical protein
MMFPFGNICVFCEVDLSTFHCPTDSCRNDWNPQESTGIHRNSQEFTGMLDWSQTELENVISFLS